MAGIPANFAGDRNLLNDPNVAGTATALGDLAALNLRTLHFLEPVLTNAGVPAADRTALADGLRNALAAANAFQTRESSTRELRPMSRIPRDWGGEDNLAQVRLNQMAQFDGEPKEAREIVRWLNRMVTASAAHDLNEQATINLLIHCSKGSASDLIDRLQNEGKGYLEIARNLELRYGELCPAEEAVVRANTLPRYHGEQLATFLDRLRYIAEMAKRNVADAAQRQAAINVLVENNIRRVLPSSVRDALEERILARTRMGQPPFTLMELEKECIELERKRDDKHQKKKAKSSIGRPKGIHAIQGQLTPYQQVYYPEAAASFDSTYADSSSEDEAQDEEGEFAVPDPTDPGLVALINNVNHYTNKYQSKGVKANPDQIFQKAISRYNKYPQQGQGFHPSQGRGQQRYNQGPQMHGKPRYQEKPQARQITAQAFPQQYPQGPRFAAPQQPYQGPPNKLEPGRLSIRDLLAKGNCVTGECIRCGQAGHVMNSDACALRGKPLQDRACTRCKKGLHAVNDCLVVFQQPQAGQVNQVTAEWSEDSDDLNE